MKHHTGQPENKVHIYNLNDETGYYELNSSPLGFDKLPNELKVEDTRQRQQIRSDKICRGRIKDGRYLFFTGLIQVGKGNLYFGDHFEFENGSKKNSFILFRFSSDQKEMTIYFFNHFKVYPGKRAKFISDFLKSLSKSPLLGTTKGGEFPTSQSCSKTYTGQL